MSHTMGVMCQECKEILVPDDRCPEGCGTGHGYGYVQSGDWALTTWPEHGCFILERARRVTGLPESAVLDDRVDQPLVDRDIYYVVLEDGTRTAWNGKTLDNPDYACVICGGDPEKMATCTECDGTGEITHVPYCDRPWDQVLPGLFIGGHDCQEGNHDPAIYGPEAAGGNVVVRNQFDLVISLHYRLGYGPGVLARHHSISMADADLDPRHHTKLDELADEVVKAIENREKVLVRCQAGMNRSGLVVGLAMLKMGWSVDDILKRLRGVRSPYVLFNPYYVRYLREVEAR